MGETPQPVAFQPSATGVMVLMSEPSREHWRLLDLDVLADRRRPDTTLVTGRAATVQLFDTAVGVGAGIFDGTTLRMGPVETVFEPEPEGDVCTRPSRGLCAVGRFGPANECVAPSPSPEVCNGLDDDCNGGVDDGAGCPAFEPPDLVAPPPPVSCPLWSAFPWPPEMWPSNPMYDPCARSAMDGPCRISTLRGDEVIEYDERGRVTRVGDVVHSWDPASGQYLGAHSARGQRRLQYDDRGRLRSVETDDGTVSALAYDDAGRLIRWDAGPDEVYRYWWDADGTGLVVEGIRYPADDVLAVSFRMLDGVIVQADDLAIEFVSDVQFTISAHGHDPCAVAVSEHAHDSEFFGPGSFAYRSRAGYRLDTDHGGRARWIEGTWSVEEDALLGSTADTHTAASELHYDDRGRLIGHRPISGGAGDNPFGPATLGAPWSLVYDCDQAPD